MLTAVVRALVARKMRVELTPVSEGNLGALEAAVERYENNANYVVCHTQAFDRYLADLCTLTIRAGEVGEEQIVAAWFDPEEPDAFASSVFHWALDDAPEDGLPDILEVLEDAAEGRTHQKSSPQVSVHTPAPAANDDSFSDRSFDASSTRDAMRLALGWRRAIRPAAVFLTAFGIALAGLYYAGLIH